VAVRGGDFITAALYLRSHLLFVIQEGSRLLTAVNETMPALLTGENIEDVEVTGGGVVYGNAEHYISYYDPVDDRFEPVSSDGSRPRNGMSLYAYIHCMYIFYCYTIMILYCIVLTHEHMTHFIPSIHSILCSN
jgi:hypothetical protein